MKQLIINSHYTESKNYKYILDYVESLDIEDIEEFLQLAGNPHKGESDLNLRMTWELHAITNARNSDKYFTQLNH
tara:strand:- start:274 stop:498 length:225 start_codon:yes stop_codon:yes gene_type:complete